MASSSSSAHDLHPREVTDILTKPNINDISTEILINIIRFLPVELEGPTNRPCNYYKPLFSLLFCSKRFHALTNTIIYRGFVEVSDCRSNSLQHFLKQILARPDLARHVKNYQGIASDTSHDDGYLDTSCFSEDDWAMIKRRVRELSHDEAEISEWTDSIAEGNWEAITALTLSLLPNIVNLEFKEWSYTNDVYPILLRLLSRAHSLQKTSGSQLPPLLSHVTRVRQDYWDTEGGMPIDLLIPLLSLPSVEVFWGKMIASIAIEDTEWIRLTPTFPHIRELSLYFVDIHSEVLETFLKSFPNLEKLYYVSGYGEFKPPRMMAALEHLKPCLKLLSVSHGNDAAAHDLTNFPIGSFRGFEKLTEVVLDPDMLTGAFYDETAREGFQAQQNLVDALPACIEQINVNFCYDDSLICKQLPSVLSQKHTRFPALRKIDIGWEQIQYPDKPTLLELSEHTGFSREEALNLLAEFEKVGVEMVIRTLPPPCKWVLHEMS